jgi:predicted nucleic acid-binding protein
MSVVVDTNVVAYYLLKTEPFTRECALFWRGAREVYAPMSWEIELVNTVWLAIGAGVLDLSEGIERLRLGAQLGINSVAVAGLWEGTLTRATAANHPAYDTVFVELAVRLRKPLVTFDQGLLRKFPDTAIRPRQFTRGS